ncbi:MAG TPA: DUF302 domain-containing protein [Methylococcaceae bacterium]|nr:DUF302 domain-containing protein [Methylococcaceae bacterium]
MATGASSAKCFSGRALALLLFAAPSLAGETTSDGFYRAETHKPFEEVVDELKRAISEHNFRLAAHNRIGAAIRERNGGDFPEYDTLQFCNLTYAEELLRLDPEGVRHMPCTLTVHSRAGKTIVYARQLPVGASDARLRDFAVRMNGQIRAIVDEGTGK